MNLEKIIFPLVFIIGMAGGLKGQNPFVLDSSKQSLNIPYLNAVEYGNKKVYTEKDSLGRVTLEIQWYDALREEIKTKYKDLSDTIVYKKDIIYDASTGLERNFYEYNLSFNKDGSFNTKEIIKKILEDRKNYSITERYNEYSSYNNRIESKELYDYEGDGIFDFGKKTHIKYKEDSDEVLSIEFYFMNEKGQFISDYQGERKSKYLIK